MILTLRDTFNNTGVKLNKKYKINNYFIINFVLLNFNDPTNHPIKN